MDRSELTFDQWSMTLTITVQMGQGSPRLTVGYWDHKFFSNKYNFWSGNMLRSWAAFFEEVFFQIVRCLTRQPMFDNDIDHWERDHQLLSNVQFWVSEQCAQGWSYGHRGHKVVSPLCRGFKVYTVHSCCETAWLLRQWRNITGHCVNHKFK